MAAYYYPFPEWEQILSRIIEKPELLKLIGNTISVVSSDSERCGVCSEVKRRQPYYKFDPVGDQIPFVCSKECFYYSWDNVVQLDKNKGGLVCRQLHPFFYKNNNNNNNKPLAYLKCITVSLLKYIAS